MNFFSSLFRRKKKDEQAALSSQITERKTGDNRELYFQLLDMIVPSETIREKVKTEIIKAFEKPESFYNESGEYIPAIRGMKLSKHIQVTPKFVFIDALIHEEQMTEVDWREEEAEIRLRIIAIMKRKRFPSYISDVEQYENLYAGDVIQMIDDMELTPTNYSLQLLDIQSDSYVFTIVPIADKKKVTQMFSKL